jgi:hypothetical protein
MKTANYIELMTESVTAMTNVFDLIRDHVGFDCSGEPCELKNNDYLALAYTMDTFRLVWNNMPEALKDQVDPEAEKIMKSFYLHLNKSDTDYYQLNGLRADASFMHSTVYRIWEDMDRARKLYFD